MSKVRKHRSFIAAGHMVTLEERSETIWRVTYFNGEWDARYYDDHRDAAEDMFDQVTRTITLEVAKVAHGEEAEMLILPGFKR
jgi:hypothetical protein